MENAGIISIYLDVCCLNRPFDDQSQARVRLEAESIRLILERITSGEWRWIGSEAMHDEVAQTPDPERRSQLSTFMRSMRTMVEVGDHTIARAAELISVGFRDFDALHLACAEIGSVDVFLTTDDRLLRTARRIGRAIHIRVENPLSWLTEITKP